MQGSDEYTQAHKTYNWLYLYTEWWNSYTKGQENIDGQNSYFTDHPLVGGGGNFKKSPVMEYKNNETKEVRKPQDSKKLLGN
jgi:hypothetical protein